MPLSAFQQFCADTGCPDNAHTLALWTQRNDAVAECERQAKEIFDLKTNLVFTQSKYVGATQELQKLKAEREQMEKQEPVYLLLSATEYNWDLYNSEERELLILPKDLNDYNADGAYEVLKLYAHPPVPDGKVLVHDGVGGAPEHFRDWFTMNIPDGTVIGNSHWWVNRVYNAMLKAAQQGE